MSRNGIKVVCAGGAHPGFADVCYSLSSWLRLAASSQGWQVCYAIVFAQHDQFLYP